MIRMRRHRLWTPGRTGLARQLALVTAVLLFLWAVAPAHRPTSLSSHAAAQDAIFTAAQAARGQALYERRCAACHGQRLEGASSLPLAGERFLARWGQGDRNVDELYYITRTQMPYGAGGTLTAQQYIDLVAYILSANGYRPGDRELPADSAALQAIRIAPPKAAQAKDAPRSPVKDAAIGAAPETAEREGKGRAPAPAAALSPTSRFPTQEELNAAAGNTTDWLHSNHDYAGQRFVDLKQINAQNVAQLRPACIFQTGDTKPFHNNPLVYRGVMYITTTWSTIAIDAKTCKQRWRHDWKQKSLEIHPPNRGAAIKDGRIVRATTDGYLFALDLETGKPLWERKLISTEKNEGSFNIAPVIFENLVLLGLGISEQGVKGWISAFRLEDGELVWRFNTVPDDGEPGAETWGNADARVKGGGAVWTPLSLDPSKGLVYVPVANPAPDFFGDIRPGANLYTSSLVVLDVRTGKLQWHYQAVPHDTHDWDLTQVSPLFTTTVKGKKRNLVSVVGKDGLLHVLDRDTKEHLYETPVTTRLNADVEPTVSGVRACPGVLGGVQWNGPAFNPGTNMLYVPAVDWCGVYRKAEAVRHIPGQLYMGGSFQEDPVEKARGWLTAIDASTGEVRWKYQSSRPMIAAVTTTSANLVFTGELTGDLVAFDAKSGKELYRFYTGGAMNGGVISYAIDGKQYLAVASGSATGFWRAAPAASTVIIFSLP